MDDITFITNEEGKTLKNRFSTLVKDTQFFDCLVGYFYASGFYAIYKSLENTEKIRILIGISTNKQTFDMIQDSKLIQQKIELSNKETKDEFADKIVNELENSEDSYDVEEGVLKFVEWLRSGKLEIRVYPAEKVHAKVYIMSFKKGDRDIGRVITGSSNFTRAGLRDNLEFNVELKNSSDYNFALNKFNELWKNSVDVSDKYVETINNKTWLNDEITPYELYLKFLYEYLKDKIQLDQKMDNVYTPKHFMDLKYQKDAVIDAEMKLKEYGGVFISDVVGLGKTFISAMLAQRLDGRTLVIAPPVLIDKNNPGSWFNVFSEFGIRGFECESLGKLDSILRRGTDKFKNIIIDEAHRFRTDSTQTYEQLFKICRGKRVILVSATPLNNTPLDILSQIKLFQNSHNSTLPNPKVKDLEKYFKKLQNRLKKLDRRSDKEEYLKIVKENSEDIRENVLQYLMVRRTRSSIVKYYSKDLATQKLKFPEVANPVPVIYNFDENLDKRFNQTMNLIINKFNYARYTPLLYLKADITQPEALSQRNMGKFMKILLLKRLESSFFAFKQSIGRFINSYKYFISAYEKGNVYVSKKDINKIFELIDNDNESKIQTLIEQGRAHKYSSKNFRKEFIKDLKSDLDMLLKVEALWRDVKQDPKLDKFVSLLAKDKNLKKNKVIVFTESKETAQYLEKKLKPKFDNKVLAFSSLSSESTRQKIIDNFDPSSRNKREDIQLLVSTDILSEGVNLNRSNVVINYDIPWNPIRIMQRVGRINRVSKNPPFDKIFTYNFFPAGPINENISLKELAEAKIKAFIEMLGNDSKLLTDEEIKSHEFLFKRLNSKEVIVGSDEEDPELRYLALLRGIRDENPDLFERIKCLPKKSRTARKHDKTYNSVLTFFRKGKLRKIFQTKGNLIEEVDFFRAAEILEAKNNLKKEKLQKDFYKYLEMNKKSFESIFISEGGDILRGRGRSYESKFIKRLKAIAKSPEFTDSDEDYIQEVLSLLKKGSLPKSTLKKILNDIKKEINPLKILARVRFGISPELFQPTFVTNAADVSGPKEVILSEYLIKK